MPGVEVRNLTVAFDGKPVLCDVTWSVPPGTLAAIIGPNGGGKSTLLRTLVGRVKPANGEVRVLGEAPGKAKARLSYLPQMEEIDWRFPIRVIDTVVQGRLVMRPWWKQAKASDWEAALAALERVRLEKEAYRSIGDLSGGQRQRMLIARALAQNAKLLLLDEPTTALDATAQHDLLAIFEELRQEGRTVIATTHDLDCLANRFDHVLCLRGRVICQGHPRVALTTETLLNLFGRHVPLLTNEGEVTMITHA